MWGSHSVESNPRATYLVLGVASGAIGSAGSAAFAGLCHLAEPFVLNLDGGIFALAHAIEPYRALFLFASAGLLLLGFGMTYLPRISRSSSVSLHVGVAGRSALWVAATMYVLALSVPLVAAQYFS